MVLTNFFLSLETHVKRKPVVRVLCADPENSVREPLIDLFFKINFFEKFKENAISFKQFGSRSGPFAKVISRQHLVEF